jgi:hypothetical protein
MFIRQKTGDRAITARIEPQQCFFFGLVLFERRRLSATKHELNFVAETEGNLVIPVHGTRK